MRGADILLEIICLMWPPLFLLWKKGNNQITAHFLTCNPMYNICWNVSHNIQWTLLFGWRCTMNSLFKLETFYLQKSQTRITFMQLMIMMSTRFLITVQIGGVVPSQWYSYSCGIHPIRRSAVYFDLSLSPAEGHCTGFPFSSYLCWKGKWVEVLPWFSLFTECLPLMPLLLLFRDHSSPTNCIDPQYVWSERLQWYSVFPYGCAMGSFVKLE